MSFCFWSHSLRLKLGCAGQTRPHTDTKDQSYMGLGGDAGQESPWCWYVWHKFHQLSKLMTVNLFENCFKMAGQPSSAKTESGHFWEAGEETSWAVSLVHWLLVKVGRHIQIHQPGHTDTHAHNDIARAPCRCDSRAPKTLAKAKEMTESNEMCHDNSNKEWKPTHAETRCRSQPLRCRSPPLLHPFLASSSQSTSREMQSARHSRQRKQHTHTHATLRGKNVKRGEQDAG